MDVFAMPAAGLSSDEAINGFYGPAVQPSAVAAAPGGGGVEAVSRASVPQWPAVLIWWFILLGAAVAMHVLFLQVPA